MSERSWLNWTGIETDFGSTFSGRTIPDDVTGSDSVLNGSESPEKIGFQVYFSIFSIKVLLQVPQLENH